MHLTIEPTTILPLEILLPMRLVIYNAGSRKLLITTTSLDLPQPIVVWMQTSVRYRHLLVAVDTNMPENSDEYLFHL